MDTTELNRLYDFHGKTVVITGGTGVLGSEIARALVGCGANVAILARRLAPAEQIVERMGRAPVRPRPSALTLSIRTACKTQRRKSGRDSEGSIAC